MKAYLRYELAATWGVISSNSNVVFDRNFTYLITASLENVSLWSLKQAVLVGGRQASCPGGTKGVVWGLRCSRSPGMHAEEGAGAACRQPGRQGCRA